MPVGAHGRKVTDEPITLLKGISPDHRWLLGLRFRGDDSDVVAFPVDGGTPIPVLLPGAAPDDSPVEWSYDGRLMFIGLQSSSGSVPNGRTIVVPLRAGQVFPPIPPGGFQSEEQIARLTGARSIESIDVSPGSTPDTYVFTRHNVQRNLYRIPLP